MRGRLRPVLSVHQQVSFVDKRFRKLEKLERLEKVEKAQWTKNREEPFGCSSSGVA